MNEVLQNIDWMQLISALWTIVLLPIFTYIGAQIGNYAKAKQADKYTSLLCKNVANAVKDTYETAVKEMKGTSDWTRERQEEVKEIAKTKAICALTSCAYRFFQTTNEDFEEYLDSLIGTALYDLKNKK